MKILNFGSMNVDNTYRVKSIVKPGETIASSGIDQNCGGKGLNQSVALARAGMEVTHAGLVGDDENGKILVEMLTSAGVDTGKIQVVPGKSGHTVIQVDEHGQNSIILFGGANRRISETYIDEVLEDIQAGELLLLQNEISNLPYLLSRAKEKDLKIILNPSPMESYLQDLDLSCVDLFFVNEIEGEQLTGKKQPEEILDEMRKKYPSSAVVLTMGTRGAFFQKGEVRECQKACKVQAVDTTGAGDTFTGFFIKMYYETGDAAKALALATKASAIAVTRFGAAQSIPELSEVTEVRL